MTCSARTKAGTPCQIATSRKYCHIHNQKGKDQDLAYKIKCQKVEINRLNSDNARLLQKNMELENQRKSMEIEISYLTYDNQELSSMREDYESYQIIKNYQLLFRKMSELYGCETSLEITQAMKEDPSKCFDDLGYHPWVRFNRFRRERNAAAHLL